MVLSPEKIAPGEIGIMYDTRSFYLKHIVQYLLYKKVGRMGIKELVVITYTCLTINRIAFSIFNLNSVFESFIFGR
jgi:hypothetical protein